MLRYGAGKYRPKTCSALEQVYSPCLGLGKERRVLLNIILTVVYVYLLSFRSPNFTVNYTNKIVYKLNSADC